jgi:hypothetical protein
MDSVTGWTERMLAEAENRQQEDRTGDLEIGEGFFFFFFV